MCRSCKQLIRQSALQGSWGPFHTWVLCCRILRLTKLPLCMQLSPEQDNQSEGGVKLHSRHAACAQSQNLIEVLQTTKVWLALCRILRHIKLRPCTQRWQLSRTIRAREEWSCIPDMLRGPHRCLRAHLPCEVLCIRRKALWPLPLPTQALSGGFERYLQTGAGCTPLPESQPTLRSPVHQADSTLAVALHAQALSGESQ